MKKQKLEVKEFLLKLSDDCPLNRSKKSIRRKYMEECVKEILNLVDNKYEKCDKLNEIYNMCKNRKLNE